jgi:amino acid transporter
MVFLEGTYSFLLLLHLFVTIVLVGSMTHGLLIVVGYLRGRFNRQKLEWLYVRVALWSYVIVYVIGALIYPAYRIRIRHDYFDPQLPWATGLFEVKEHWGAVGLAMFFVLYLFRRNLRPAEEKDKLWLYVPLCFLLNVIVWYKVVVGCYLTLLKGSWS